MTHFNYPLAIKIILLVLLHQCVLAEGKTSKEVDSSDSSHVNNASHSRIDRRSKVPPDLVMHHPTSHESKNSEHDQDVRKPLEAHPDLHHPKDVKHTRVGPTAREHNKEFDAQQHNVHEGPAEHSLTLTRDTKEREPHKLHQQAERHEESHAEHHNVHEGPVEHLLASKHDTKGHEPHKFRQQEESHAEHHNVHEGPAEHSLTLTHGTKGHEPDEHHQQGKHVQKENTLVEVKRDGEQREDKAARTVGQHEDGPSAVTHKESSEEEHFPANTPGHAETRVVLAHNDDRHLPNRKTATASDHHEQQHNAHEGPVDHTRFVKNERDGKAMGHMQKNSMHTFTEGRPTIFKTHSEAPNDGHTAESILHNGDHHAKEPENQRHKRPPSDTSRRTDHRKEHVDSGEEREQTEEEYHKKGSAHGQPRPIDHDEPHDNLVVDTGHRRKMTDDEDEEEPVRETEMEEEDVKEGPPKAARLAIEEILELDSKSPILFFTHPLRAVKHSDITAAPASHTIIVKVLMPGAIGAGQVPNIEHMTTKNTHDTTIVAHIPTESSSAGHGISTNATELPHLSSDTSKHSEHSKPKKMRIKKVKHIKASSKKAAVYQARQVGSREQFKSYKSGSLLMGVVYLCIILAVSAATVLVLNVWTKISNKNTLYEN